MPRLTKIYTRKGDEGMTSLGSRKRVPKDSIRVSAYGDVDELNSLIGVALATKLAPKLEEALLVIQNELFHLGTDLAFPVEERGGIEIPQIEAGHVERLENFIDEMLGEIGPLQNFILPGGSSGAASLQVARAVCRRAERSLVTLAREEPVGEYVLQYLNRLSDALFTMARYENFYRGINEQLWDSLA